MNFSKNTIKDNCHELRIWMSGRGGKSAKRRFKTNKDLENFKIQALRLYALKPKLVERFLDGEDYDLLIEEHNNPHAHTEGALNTFGMELEYWKNHQYSTFSPGWKKTLDGYFVEFADLNKMAVKDITPALLDEIDAILRAKKGRPNSRKTINQKLGWIQSVLNFSVERTRIAGHPVANYKKKKAPEPDFAFWEKVDALDFLSFTEEKYPIDSKNRWVYAAYLTALNSGVRASELWALKPKCIRKSCNVLRIDEQFDVKAKEFRILKGKEARNAPLNAEVSQELDRLIQKNKIARHEVVFGLGPLPVDHNNFRRDFFEKDLKDWGGPKIRFHELRHTAGTLMVASEIDLKTVQVILGHKDINTTMRYVHALGGAVKSVAAKFSLSAEPAVAATTPPPVDIKSEISNVTYVKFGREA